MLESHEEGMAQQGHAWSAHTRCSRKRIGRVNEKRRARPCTCFCLRIVQLSQDERQPGVRAGRAVEWRGDQWLLAAAGATFSLAGLHEKQRQPGSRPTLS